MKCECGNDIFILKCKIIEVEIESSTVISTKTYKRLRNKYIWECDKCGKQNDFNGKVMLSFGGY
jgi:hypothetical protein